MTSFIHLRVHSEYSIVDGIVRLKPLVKAVHEKNMFACALTDQNNLFGAVKFYKAAMAAGVKPIFGMDVFLESWRVTLLCQNNEGYKNLTRLISRAYMEGQVNGVPVIKLAWLLENNAGLLLLQGKESEIGQALLTHQTAQAEKLYQLFKEKFSQRFYLEIQRTGRADEEIFIDAAVEFASRFDLPLVATNDVRFLTAEDYEAHEARVCIYDGVVLADPQRQRKYSAQQYLRSSKEMEELFSDLPEALANTVEIAKRCNVTLNLGKNFLPQFPIPSNTTIEKYLADQSNHGLTKRLQEANIAERKSYDERLAFELSVINSMGFAGYFLIVADFIAWAKNNGVPVGPGRGSGAGSLVAYALGITDVNPLPYDLLFERFLNPERISMPDFDIDFCMDGRDRVIDYVAQKYGRESVAQIITYGSMAAKAVVRDVGRVLAHPYGFVDKIAKLIPFELGMTLDKALEQEEELRARYNDEEEVKTLLDLAKKLEGLTRNAGKHAGGVVISPSLLTDFTPIYCEPDGDHPVSQFDKDDVEAVGLVKFDFLGLRTLTIIAHAVENINQQRRVQQESLLDIAKLVLDDKKTFQLIKDCSTTAVFQLESRGMKDLIKRLQPASFEDIISLVALFRPGPLQSGMVDDFINRRHGRARVEYPHPLLESVLRPTYGMILYQEQVMQIAQILAGYTLGSADLLRKAMGKKKVEEMAKQRAIFIEGAVQRNVDAHVANTIFDLMEKFAEYGFNKSHSAAYAMVAYQTAWLKAHYPAEFMAAVLSSDMDNTDKVVDFLQECYRMKLAIIPPNINRSEYRFTVTEKGEILYGLGAIKGMGESIINHIVEKRKADGLFTDLFSFCQRLDSHKLNRRALEALIKSGAFDSFAVDRAVLFANVDKALLAAEQKLSAKNRGQGGLFDDEPAAHHVHYNAASPWTEKERLQNEKTTLGFYLSGHPLQQYAQELSHFTTAALADIAKTQKQTLMVAGLVVGMRTMFTKRGDRMAFIQLEDQTARVELTIFSEMYEKNKKYLVSDQIIVVEGEVSLDDFTGNHKLIARNLYSLDMARERFAKCLLLSLQAEKMAVQDIQRLQKILHPACPGFCPVYIEYETKEAKAKVALGEQWKVKLSDELLVQLRSSLGEQQVAVCY